jgi:hypothetical protein
MILLVPQAGCNLAAPAALTKRDITFQSSPDPRAGCNTNTYANHPCGEQFQSSPGIQAACKILEQIAKVLDAVFQYSPGPGTQRNRYRLGQETCSTSGSAACGRA